MEEDDAALNFEIAGGLWIAYKDPFAAELLLNLRLRQPQSYGSLPFCATPSRHDYPLTLMAVPSDAMLPTRRRYV
jgi:hypothetical protein